MADTPKTQAPEARGEVVTRALVQDVALAGDAGTLALITLDNGFDHTKPNTFGPEGIAGLQAAVDTLRTRAEAGEIQAVGITGKPFIFAVGADLTGENRGLQLMSPGLLPGRSASVRVMLSGLRLDDRSRKTLASVNFQAESAVK